MANKRVYVDWEKIELLIKQSGVNLSEYSDSAIVFLSQHTGMHWTTVKRLKVEQSTTLQTLGKIADAIGCSPIDLITAEGYPDPKFVALAVA